MMLISSDSWKHVEFLFSGATALALVGHMVNTFPTPKNIYGQWLLGVIKFAVGQRISAMNAFQGNDTAVVAVPQGSGAKVTAAMQGTGSGSSSQTASTHTEVTPDSIKVATEEVKKTETVLPKIETTPKP
jgi:hypothetical protein